MATNAAFEPFEYVDDNNNIVGYDIVVADKIAESLGKELEIQTSTSTRSSPLIVGHRRFCNSGYDGYRRETG